MHFTSTLVFISNMLVFVSGSVVENQELKPSSNDESAGPQNQVNKEPIKGEAEITSSKRILEQLPDELFRTIATGFLSHDLTEVIRANKAILQ